MATGYTRKDTSNNINNGNIINAEDLDLEFDGIQAAMDAITGHIHDGTVGGGAPIVSVGPVQDVVITTGTLRPKTDNTIDLGTSTFEFKDLYIDGIAYVDTLQVDESATIAANLTVTGNATISTNLTVNGNTTIGNAATDTITMTADVASNLIPSANNTYDLGASTDEWRDIWIDGTATIDTLQVDESATITANLTVNGNTTLGNAATDTVTITADVASNLIPSVDDTHDLGSATDEWRNIYIDGTAQVDTLQVDESATITANLTVNGNTTLGNAATDTVTVTADVASNLIPSADNTYDLGATGSEWKDLYITGTANIDSLVADTAAISAGTATLSAATVITTTGGTVTLQRNDSAIITGETLGAVDFQAPNVAGGGNATLVTASIKAVSDITFDATNNKTSLLLQTANADVVATRVEVTGEGHVLPGADDVYDLGATTREWRNLYIDGTANIDSLVADTADINGGTIDGATIGATTPAAGTFTSVTAPSVTITGGTINGATIGATTAAAGTFTSVTAPSVTITGGTITGITDLAVADGGTGVSTLTGYVKGNGTSAFTASATVPSSDISGLGTMSTQDANAVAITGGSVTGITDLAVADGGTGASTLTGYVKGDGTTPLTASATIPNTDITGLGTMSVQNANSVAITGGSINGTTIGASSASTIAGTTGNFSGDLTIADKIVHSGDTNTSIRFPAADTVTVETAGDERMRIDSAGNVGIGTTTLVANRRLQVDGGALIASVFKNSASANEVIDIWNSATSGNNVFVEWQTEAGSTARGSVSYNRGGGLVAYNTTSDYRAKDIAGKISDASSTVLSLKPYMGTMKGATIERPMFIAHETQEIAPYAVTGEKDAVDNEGNPTYQQMDHSALVPLLTAALQEALAEISNLKIRITALEATQ